MKHQYFGDINDFNKYVLLRRLHAAGLSLHVVWMLTPDDDSKDGRKTEYLDYPGRRSNDPELFDWLVARERGRHFRQRRICPHPGSLRSPPLSLGSLALVPVAVTAWPAGRKSKPQNIHRHADVATFGGSLTPDPP